MGRIIRNYFNIANWKIAIEIVSFPIKKKVI